MNFLQAIQLNICQSVLSKHKSEIPKIQFGVAGELFLTFYMVNSYKIFSTSFSLLLDLQADATGPFKAVLKAAASQP